MQTETVSRQPTELLQKILDSRANPRQDGGRNILAGHLRGWGLEFGDLADVLRRDPNYKKARALSVERDCLLPEHKLLNLFLIITYFLNGSEGDIVEFGSYKGGSASFMGALVRNLKRPNRVFAFDSYSGMPETDSTRDLHAEGDFSDTIFEDFSDFLNANALAETVIPVRGFFEDTFPRTAHEIPSIALAHIDCDLYDAVRFSINAVRPRMHFAGGYIVFDDPLHGSCLGAMEAIESEMYHREHLFAEQAYPHLVFRYPPGQSRRSLLARVRHALRRPSMSHIHH